MKFFTIPFICLCILSSCSNSKNIDSEEEIVNTTDLPTKQQRIVGTVNVSDNDCKLYIDAEENGIIVKIYPLNLDQKFQVAGMYIKFNYEISSTTNAVNGCNIEKVVTLSDVTPLRQR